jgi:NADPH-dependent curcumin reductase CurA
MTATTAQQVQLVRYPDGKVRPDDFRVVEAPLAGPATDEVLVRNTWCSVDPGMRLQMRPAGPAGYFPAFALEAPLGGMAVGEVVESRSEHFAPGDVVVHANGWRDYAVVAAGGKALRGIGTLRRVDTALAPAQAFLGVLGGPGLTAYAGLLHVAELRADDVVWISAAAVDNVGGEHLEAALGSLRRWGRVAICGAVSEYERNVPAPGIRNLFQAVANDLTLRGFRGSSYVEHRPAFERDVAGWLRDGRIRYRETVVDGLEHAPDAIVQQLAGGTTGKVLVRVT